MPEKKSYTLIVDVEAYEMVKDGVAGYVVGDDERFIEKSIFEAVYKIAPSEE